MSFTNVKKSSSLSCACDLSSQRGSPTLNNFNMLLPTRRIFKASSVLPIMLKLRYQQVHGGYTMKKVYVTANVPPPLRLHQTAALLLCALHAQVSLRSFLVQDCFIPNYSQTTPYVQPCSGSQPASFLISTGVITRDQNSRGIKLTSRHHRLQRL